MNETKTVISTKTSPDIEDVRAVALPTLRHRNVRNFKAEGISVEQLIKRMV